MLAVLALLVALVSASPSHAAETQTQSRLRITWGHRSAANTAFHLRLAAEGMSLGDVKGISLEPGEGLRDEAWQTRAGGEDVDGVEVALQYEEIPAKISEPSNPIWRDLMAKSDADAARRLRLDPAIRRDPRRLTVRTNADATRGFSVTMDQLLQNKAIWAPSLDVYLAAGDAPLPFAEHQKELENWKGKRILDQVEREPEATYAEYTARWEDMGSPAYTHPRQPPPGHIVGVTWDSAIPKFGIDRGAGVWNDYGNPDRFRLWFDFGERKSELAGTWKGQSLVDGLPIIETTIEKDGLRYEVEQFAYPLDGPPPERRGDIAMVLVQRVRVVNLDSEPKTADLCLTHGRELAASDEIALVAKPRPDGLLVERSDTGHTLLTIQGPGAAEGTLKLRPEKLTVVQNNRKSPLSVADVRVALTLPAGGSREFIVKLPSPPATPQEGDKLLALDYAKARAETVEFWSDYLARGAQFRVPEKVVNDLFRANLWHALRLPRRHGGGGPDVKIDLPYSNFAYDQKGTPWPVNQAVLVDYMLYDLRGYHDVSREELLSQYRNNQEASGHVGGFANWGVYTPGMIYASAKHYLLSQDRAGFEQLLPPTLKALDWCLAEIRRTSEESGRARGLLRAPLNDGTKEGVWAFNQAYVYAALETLGQALKQYGHPRARECLDAAGAFRQSVERAFAAATVEAPLVQLRDHTWSPYVPCEVLTPRRLMEQWYPTDVDTGAVHLLRLGAIPSVGPLADCLLHDHEDNLFLNGWGMANEPVYNQQAAAYLLRDEPKAVIRAFYSMTACAFSHSALEPVEHRWTWGQYFGPPSTDGTWFELYRNMLVRESDDDSLLLFQATPRAWLEDGKRIEIERAPTHYGKLSASVESRAAAGEIRADIDTRFSRAPKTLLVRFRHPQGKPMRSAALDGKAWTAIDREKELVIIANPAQSRYKIVAQY